MGQGQAGPQAAPSRGTLYREALGRRLPPGLDVDLIDVRRVERILVHATEEEVMPQLPLPIPAGRFARPGNAFAQTNQYRHTA